MGEALTGTTAMAEEGHDGGSAVCVGQFERIGTGRLVVY